MDFTQIYHNQPLSKWEKPDIVHRRHAEVHVPWRLSLEALQYVYARSSAERETLQTLISSEMERNVTTEPRIPNTHIRVNARGSLFNNRWSYVEKVSVLEGEVRISFNPSSMTPGPFALEMTIKDREGQLPERSLIRQGFFANLPLTARFPVEFQQRPFRLTLTLDDSLAYMHDLDPAIGNVQLIT